ncbi:hypothetical protein Q3G72_032414 [Acer saccharum]|nr:hypothetical protein Q3G72_032414 [Acer saccharum]
MVHNNLSVQEEGVVLWAAAFLVEFRRANDYVSECDRELPKVAPKWIPPDGGSFKMNNDAAIDRIKDRVGIGVIIWNGDGNVLASSAQRIDAAYSPQIAEAMALLRGILFSREVGLWPCFVESNAKVVVDLINAPDVLDYYL